MARDQSPSSLSRLHLDILGDGVQREAGERIDLPEMLPLEDAGEVVRRHQFSPRANWLVPGKILLGKYPGQIPADMPHDLQAARDRVRDIVLRGNVTDLLCLQAEIPPQNDEHLWSPPDAEGDTGLFSSGFRAYRGDALAAVAEERVAPQADFGVDSVREKLTFHHFPITDLSPAENMDVLSALIAKLNALVMSGKVVFIHCWAGRGRTGLIAACLLGKLYPQLTVEQALNRVDAYYRTRGPVAVGKTCRVSPETEDQERQVDMFFRDVLRR